MLLLQTIADNLLFPFIGAIIALLVIPPKTRSEAMRRGAVSMACGWVAGPTLHEWLGIAGNAHNAGFSKVLAAFLSWWILGALPKASTRWLNRDGGATD